MCGVLVAQLCPTLCDPMDCNLPGSCVHGILQARVLEWVATLFSKKFVYSCSVKICGSGFDELLESIFCLLLVVEAFSLQKVVEMIEEVVVIRQEVR